MKSFARAGFTLVELLVGVVMMSIVIAGIAFTVSSGFDLFTKAESNAVVISGVRFTADSFERTVAPMLNVTDQIELLSADAATIPAPASLSEDIHYVFLSSDAVVHRDSKGDHVLEGSEYIDSLEFMIPVSSEDTQENYIFKMGIHGKNSDQPKAKLDLEVESALYNRPEKKGTPVSGILRGAILKIRASLYLDRLDLYDNDTKIKINGLTMHKGTTIEAVYDLINQTGTSQPMSDESVIEWFISGSVSADLSVTEAVPTKSNRNSYYWQLVSEDTPLTGKILDTEETPTDWETVVIRCRVTPVVKSSGGDVTVTGVPRWSDYVIVRALDAPSEEFETILDVVNPAETGTPVGTNDVYITDVGSQSTGPAEENVFTVNSSTLSMSISSPSTTNYGASFITKVRYDKFHNDRIYAAWAAGRTSSSDIPSYMTMTNYSVVTDIMILNSATRLALFLSTRSNNPNFSSTNKSFKDLGYAIQYLPPKTGNPVDKGFFVSKYKNGEEIEESNKSPYAFGIYNETELEYKNNGSTPHDYYYPETTNNSVFTFLQWQSRHRIIYTVLEYFDETQGKAYPRYIFRVRLLKRTDPDVMDKVQLAEIKKRDPWCIGPDFYASEPMWFGDFVGNPNTTRTTSTTTVKVKNYNDTTPQTATLDRPINIAAKIFYALKNASNSTVLRKRAMNARASELNIDGSAISDTGISDILGGAVLSNPERSRYVGVKGVIENSRDPEDSIIVYGLDFAPGFSINEIRSIMPANGKLYSLEETIPTSELLKIQDKDWYKSYKNIIASSENDINKKVFGTAAKSAGIGDNGSWYYQNAGNDGGIYDLQHIKNNCNCPLHNELFKWLSGQ